MSGPAHKTRASGSKGVKVSLDFQKLHLSLRDIVNQSDTESQITEGILSLLLRLTNASAAKLWAVEESRAVIADEVKNQEVKLPVPLSSEKVEDLVQRAVREGRVRVLKLKGRGKAQSAVIAAPVFTGEDSRGAFTVDLAHDGASLDPFIVILQLVAGYTWFGPTADGARVMGADNGASGTMLGLVRKIAESEDIELSGMLLVSELRKALKCERVALGMCGIGFAKPVTVAVSGFDRVDRRSAFIMGLEAALDESVGLGEPTVWPISSDQARARYLAHETFFASLHSACIVTVPLRRESGKTTGVMFLSWRDKADMPSGYMKYVDCMASCLGPVLSAVRSSEPSRTRKHLRRLLNKGFLKNSYARAGLALLASVLLFVPIWRLPVRAKCQLKPVVSRTVCAPFDGILERSEVRVGDIVEADDLLAEMDGSEIEMALAGLVAEQYRARKLATQSLARNQVAERQMAEYEQEKLGQDIKLLESRAKNLELRSPIKGVVLSGELDRAEGAPLIKGQRLFEIAPLDRMLVEIFVSDSEVRFVEKGMPVGIRLDSYPGMDFRGEVFGVRPMSEIVDMRNVFIAEVEILNGEGMLRPGMKGRAVVRTRRSPLVWQVLHVPLRFMSNKLAGY